MKWLRLLVKRWLGHTEYHRQSNEVQVRLLRAQRIGRAYERADEQMRRRRGPA